MQWESFNEKPLTSNTTSKGGIHSIKISIAVEAKIAALMHRIEALEVKGPFYVNQVNQFSHPTFSTVELQIMYWRNDSC